MTASAKQRMRLDRFLANTGFGSRKDVKEIIKKGRVTVNDHIVKSPKINLDPYEDEVRVDGQPVGYQEFYYLMMNKPAGVITATEDSRQQTVMDLLPDLYSFHKLFPLGRLDKDTEGLLILSNDGKLAHRLLSPKRHVPKVYYALVDGEVNHEDISVFRRGIRLEEDFTTLPAELEIIQSGKPSHVKVTIYEGKYHQVKRMFQAVGKKVIYLKRIAMGNLSLDESLAPGEARELSEEEVDCLRNSAE
ncbi:MAG: pseudouridine synthase [Clostridia bacterium]|jgi:16S rRNA pseudouridine516 synthase